jgi:malonyl CoA-acyl carrier protein transacylase
MVADGITEAEELGPGKVLQGLIAKTSRDVTVTGRQ